MADFKNAKVYKSDEYGRTRGARLGADDLTGPAGEALKAHIGASPDQSGVFEHDGRHFAWTAPATNDTDPARDIGGEG